MSANPIKMIKDDHQKVARLFQEIDRAQDGSPKTKASLFHELRSELELHSDIEEQFLYPLLEENDETRNLALDSYEEHGVVRSLLHELDDEDVGSATWHDKIRTIQDNVEQHVSEEEDEVLPEAEKLLSGAQLRQLADNITRAKAGNGRRGGTRGH